MAETRTIKKLIHCARCDGTHENLVFKPFTRPPIQNKATHFCICPISNEPILLFDE